MVVDELSPSTPFFASEVLDIGVYICEFASQLSESFAVSSVYLAAEQSH